LVITLGKERILSSFSAGGVAASRAEAAIDGMSFSLHSPPASYTLCYKRIYRFEVVGENFCAIAAAKITISVDPLLRR
jgi:hypothetical protein